jgi:ABC-type Fe3+-hydroxamate transport system substrate-binding protein
LRLVVLSPAIAVMLRDIGLADRVVGRHAYDFVLARDTPVCGDQLGIDYEALLRVRPTHILAQEGAKGLPDRLTALAAEQGWKIRVFPLLRLDDIQSCVNALHTEFVIVPRDLSEGTDPPVLAGDAVMRRRADAEDRLVESLRFRGRHLAGAGRILLLGAVSPPAVLGPGSWHHQILERIGGAPAVTKGQPFMTLDAEDVLRLAPDAIILILPRPPNAPAPPNPATAAELRALLGRVGELDIPAVRDGKLALIDDPLAHTPSTAMAGLADELARLLDAWSR